MSNLNGKLYCTKIKGWCANGLNCNRNTCINKEKAPAETAISKSGANLNNQVENTTYEAFCQGGKYV